GGLRISRVLGLPPWQTRWQTRQETDPIWGLSLVVPHKSVSPWEQLLTAILDSVHSSSQTLSWPSTCAIDSRPVWYNEGLSPDAFPVRFPRPDKPRSLATLHRRSPCKTREILRPPAK